MLKALRIWIPMMTAAMLLTACINDCYPEDCTDPDEEEPAGDVYIHFRLSLGDDPDSRADGNVETPGNPETTTPGTANENAINTVDILVFDADDDKLCDAVYLSPVQIKAAKSEKGVTVPIMVATGKTLHIYAAVNMTDRMRGRFIYGQCGTDVSYASGGKDFWNVMDEFIPGSGGRQEKLGSSGIPMTGQFKGPDGFDIKVAGKHDNIDNALKLSAELSRIVAKVHLLAKSISYTTTYGKTDEYVISAENSAAYTTGDADQNTFENWLGWMRLSDVRYIVNGTNKSTYLFEQKDENDNPKDLNMNLQDYRSGNYFAESLWSKDFNYYHGIALHDANISNNGYFGRAEKFDEGRLERTKDPDGSYSDDKLYTRYTKGLYCLENYFHTPTEDYDFYEGQKNAIPMVTHLSIATRLVPRNLLVLTDFPGKLDDFFKAAKEANYSEDFYKSYGITKEDINLENDANLWDDIKIVYFGTDYTREKPVENVEYGLSQVFRKDFYMFPARNIEEANRFINWSLIVRGLWSGDDTDFKNGKYPRDTYFVYDTDYDGVSSVSDTDRKYVYLVAGAVALANGDNIGIKLHSVPHVGGWGYYSTYIENNKSTVDDGDGVTPFDASNVTRNRYYIITVDNFGTPGGTITDPEYIKVNTDPVSWDYAGKGDINLH